MDEQKPDADVDLNDTERAAFRRLLDMLHTEYQFDFREYKTVSLLRRVRARMSQVRVEGFDTYIDYLRLHANEAAALAFANQAPHPNAIHGKDVAEENHPTTKDQVVALHALAEQNGGKVEWVNCGLCVDERGVGEFAAGRRGTPGDFHAFCEAADNVLVIPVK